MTEPNQILVVDDSPTQLRLLEMVLERNGCDVRGVSSAREALELIASDPPMLVITDLQMPDMDGFELVAEIKQTAASIPVIVTTSEGSEEVVVRALHAGATNYIPKRDLESDLLAIVDQVLSVNRASRSVERVAKFAVESSIRLVINNDETLVPSVISRLELPMVELDLFDEGERMQIAMALDEALLNAIVHGNLEVSSDLREIDDGKPYTDLIERRKRESPYQERRVGVALQATSEFARFTICDDGPGFDASQLHDPTDPDNLEKCGGRGLLLINSFMDEVLHNKAGNEITMLKRKQSDDG